LLQVQVDLEAMPGVATELVNSTLATGKSVLERAKGKDGYVKWVVEKVEAPAIVVLDSGVGKAALNVGDRVVKFADNTVDTTMNNSVVKNGRKMVKDTYTNRVLPVTTAVSTKVSTTTAAVTTPIAKVYTGSLEMCDRTVERFLPADEKKELPLTPMVIGRKITRRSVNRARAARANAGKYYVSAKAKAAYAVEQAKPENIKKNSKIVYNKSIARTDKFIDRVLPEDDNFIATGPVTLAKKVTQRGAKRANKAAQAAMRAVRSAPDTFKKSAKKAYVYAAKQAELIKARALQIAEMRKQVAPRPRQRPQDRCHSGAAAAATRSASRLEAAFACAVNPGRTVSRAERELQLARPSTPLSACGRQRAAL